METVLLVGGSKGIGAATISKISSEYKVINFSRSAPNDSVDITHHEIDITKDELPELDELNHIIYCPGTINLKPINSLKIEDFKHDMGINLYGAIAVIKKYLKLLKKADNASITLFSTVAVKQGMPFHASVAAAKGAIEGLTRSLAAELAPKVRVNCIAPTITNTPLASGILRNEAMIDKMKDRHPLKNILEADEIADMVHFLVAKGKNITGQVMHVDAGLSSLKL